MDGVKDNLSELIAMCIACAPEEPWYARDFALYYARGGESFHDSGGEGHEWRAVIGGSPAVMLGEYEGDFRGEGETPEKAVLALINVLSSR